MMVVWAISPPLSYSGVARLLVLLGVGLFLAVSINRYNENSKYTFLVIVGLVVYVYASSFISGEGVNSRNIQILIYLCNILFFLYYKNNPAELKELRRVLWIALIINTIFNITTLTAYSTQANVSRLLAKNFDGAEVYARQGVGGFGYVYTTLLILPLDFAMLRSKRISKLEKAVIIAHIATSIYMIISSGYTLAVISLLIIAAISIVIPVKADGNSIFKRALLVLAIFTVIALQWNSIQKGIVNISEGTMYEEKVHDILFGVEDGEDGSFGVREERYERSIKTFLMHPVFGSMKFSSVGKHSFILDSYAQYGFFVGTAFLMVITLSSRYYYKKKSVAKKLSVTELVLPVVLLTLNSMVFAYSVVLFILYPTVNSLCEEKQIEKSKYNNSGIQRREISGEMH